MHVFFARKMAAATGKNALRAYKSKVVAVPNSTTANSRRCVSMLLSERMFHNTFSRIFRLSIASFYE